MTKKAAVPDAWDDDWESQADKEDGGVEIPNVLEEPQVTKAERLAEHTETNKKLWQSAEEPETFHFLAARDTVPLRTEFKPTLKVLSRKPAPKTIQKIDPITGLAKMTIEDDDEEVDETKNRPTPEELRLKAQREREGKQKRYDEVRARIMGTPSGGSSPGTVTPPADVEGGSRANRGRGRGRGGGRQDNTRPASGTESKELYDPDFTPKPAVTLHKRNGDGSRSGRSTPRDEEQVIRAPRGPDGSGRGGFGVANHGEKKS